MPSKPACPRLPRLLAEDVQACAPVVQSSQRRSFLALAGRLLGGKACAQAVALHVQHGRCGVLPQPAVAINLEMSDACPGLGSGGCVVILRADLMEDPLTEVFDVKIAFPLCFFCRCA